MIITSMSLLPHPSDAPAYYNGDTLRRSRSSSTPSLHRAPVLKTTMRTTDILDSSAGEGLRRSVLMRNALARFIAARHAAACEPDELPAYDAYQVSTRDYDEDEDAEQNDDQEHGYDGSSLVVPLSMHRGSVVDVEEQWFDELLGEVSSLDIDESIPFVDPTIHRYSSLGTSSSSSKEDVEDEEEDLESLAEARHSHRVALARRRSSGDSINLSGSDSSLPGLVDDTDDDECSDDELASSSLSDISCDSPPTTPTDVPIASSTWNIKYQLLPQTLDIGPPALA